MSSQSADLFRHVFEFTLTRDKYVINATKSSSEMKIIHTCPDLHDNAARVRTEYHIVGNLDEIKYLITRAKYYAGIVPSSAKTLMNSVLDSNRPNVTNSKPVYELHRF